jgi:hypothetical protein
VAAPAAPAPADAPPPLKAALAACATGVSEEERFAVFTGSMPAYRGTKRMAMRFDLFIRIVGSDDWLPVKSKGFGRWERSDPNREGFVYTKRVERLLQGAGYRVAVRFRWYQSAGAARPDRVRRTPVCRQPDQRPNLALGDIQLLPGPRPGTAVYRVTVANTGRSAAGAFELSLTSAEPADVRTIAGLPAGERATVELVGGVCSATAPARVTVDPQGLVDESVESDNRSSGTCPGR